MRTLRRECGAFGLARSGFGMESDLAASADAGFACHLTKPIDFAQLLRTVQELLSASASPTDAPGETNVAEVD
jgi:CheY-like chemotaxis protein